jgi:hypothetical protein
MAVDRDMDGLGLLVKGLFPAICPIKTGEGSRTHRLAANPRLP